jgi:uncharacterized membrane protein
MSDADRRGGRQYHRGEVEFGRIVGFSDGIFGIAMTLLVAGIAVPEVAKQDLGRALADNADEIYSFGLSFAVIGFLWLGHHGFFRLLTHMDDRLMRINLAYLGLIAFMPFPTALLGRYDGDVVAVALYAVVLAIASVTEAVMFRPRPAASARWRDRCPTTSTATTCGRTSPPRWSSSSRSR